MKLLVEWLRKMVSKITRGHLTKTGPQLPRAKRKARKGDLSTNYLGLRRSRSTNNLERSEMLGRKIGQPITSSEARG